MENKCLENKSEDNRSVIKYQILCVASLFSHHLTLKIIVGTPKIKNLKKLSVVKPITLFI